MLVKYLLEALRNIESDRPIVFWVNGGSQIDFRKRLPRLLTIRFIKETMGFAIVVEYSSRGHAAQSDAAVARPTVGDLRDLLVGLDPTDGLDIWFMARGQILYATKQIDFCGAKPPRTNCIFEVRSEDGSALARQAWRDGPAIMPRSCRHLLGRVSNTLTR